MGGDSLGGKLGTRIAAINAKTRLDTLDRAAPLVSRLVMAAQEDFFRQTGAELASTMGPFYAKIAEREGAPPWLADTTKFLAKGKGQWATLLAGTATGSLLGSGLLAVFTNWLQPVTGELIRESPNAPLSVADAAQANIRGLSWGPDLWEDAGQQGVNQDRFRVIEALASTVLTATEILELLNREQLDTGEALKLFKRAGWDLDQAERYLPLRHTLVSIQEAAAMINRDIITIDQAKTIARHNGYTEADMDKFNLLAGEPPAISDLILAWRRGIITESDVDRGIIEGPLRPEWIPVAKALQWIPLDPQELANAVNQGHMDLAKATLVATYSGLKPDDFKVVIDNAGIPPGPQEALDWISRGIINEDDFRTIFLESRIKNKYIDLYLKARPNRLTMAEVRLLFARGAMTEAQAVTRLALHGYSAEDAQIILRGAKAQKSAHTRDLTQAQTVKLYNERVIARADAEAMLGVIGYDAGEISLLLDMADLDRAVRFTNAAIGHIHSRFIARHIEESQASSAMDQLQVLPEQRDDLIKLWTIERQVSTKELTTAEILTANKKGIFLSGPTFNKLVAIGYAPEDALVKLKIVGILTPLQTQEDLQFPAP